MSRQTERRWRSGPVRRLSSWRYVLARGEGSWLGWGLWIVLTYRIRVLRSDQLQALFPRSDRHEMLIVSSALQPTPHSTRRGVAARNFPCYVR